MDSRAPSKGGVGRSTVSDTRTAGDCQLSRASDSATVGAPVSEGTAGSVRQAVGSRAHVLIGIPRSQTTSETDDGVGPSKRVRKERGPNWSEQEVKALIEAKRKLHNLEHNTTNARELMIPDAGKWQRISTLVMEAGVSPCQRDGFACKSKWNQLMPDYKRIADFVKRTGSDDTSFWHLLFARRREEGLPRLFSQEVFLSIHERYGIRPAMLPAHGRDLLEPEDTSLRTTHTSSDGVQHLDGSHEGSEDHHTHLLGDEDIDDLIASTQSPTSMLPGARAQLVEHDHLPSRSASPLLPRKGSLPAGVIPVVISSSEAGSLADRPASTGVRRKNVSGHTLIAEATKLTGNALTAQMRDAANVSREIEKSKLDMQVHQFEEQMAYQRERDRRLNENSKLTNDNAKLSIVKQGEVVLALSTMASVLSAAFLHRPVEGMPHSQEAHAQAIPSEGGHGSPPSRIPSTAMEKPSLPQPLIEKAASGCTDVLELDSDPQKSQL